MIPKTPIPWITDEDIISKMLTPPSTPVVRSDFSTPIHDNGRLVDVVTRQYWTPGPAETVHPGPRPIAPVLPKVPQQPAQLQARDLHSALAYHTKMLYEKNVASWILERDQYTNFRMPAYRTALAKWDDQLKAFEKFTAYKNSLDLGTYEPTPAPTPDMILTHGRGSDFDTPALVGFNLGFARTQSVLCFSSDKKVIDTETNNHRAATFRSIQNIYPSTTLGGRSFGALAAARAANDNDNVERLIFYTVTITRGLEDLAGPLLALDESVDILFIVGNADERCPEIVLHPLRKKIRARSWWLKVERGDHALLFTPEQKRLDITQVIGQIAAEWNRDEGSRDPEKTEMVLGWTGDDFSGRPQWTEWMAPQDEGLIKKR